MKYIYKLGIIFLTIFALGSCMDLDINTDPDSPTSTSGSIATRVPAIQFWMGQTYQCAGFFGSLINQQITLSNRGDRYGSLAEWTGNDRSASTYPYQAFFVGAAGTFPDLYVMAEKEGAYHYMGVVKLFRAWGFITLLDVYGEMPYTEALGAEINPKYDDGKTIFEGCLLELDEAIELFKKQQDAEATPLAAGDSWNGGDINKWIKMCYGLKARWLNNLSKKSSLYDPAAILEALANAPQSNADNTIINHQNRDGYNIDNLWGDPVFMSYMWIWLSNWSRTYYVTKWYADLLTDFDGKGIVDPRANKLIPSVQVGGADKYWLRTSGVDMQSDIRLGTNWVSPATYEPETKLWTEEAQRDSAVISLQASSVASNFRDVATDGTIINSGTFYSRPESPSHLLCYPEMCFIKAEALFRQNKTTEAYQAYKDGIQAHMELMNEKLREFDNSDNIAKTPISQADIATYLNSEAVGTAGNLTLGKIMMQKFIALSFSLQNWNDMRRMDYSSTIYKGWAEPYERTSGANDRRFIPEGKQFRRLGYVSHEYNYNQANLKDSHPSALLDDIFSFPVWWDYAGDDYK